LYDVTRWYYRREEGDVIMKKILVLGVGAQGSTVAMKLDEEPNVSEIICADYNKNAVDTLVKVLKKGKGIVVDGSRKEEILAAAQGVDLIVNAMPLDFGRNPVFRS
jgi:saccharopine dehydrogenase-like NADP-dependent oxidoreductase